MAKCKLFGNGTSNGYSYITLTDGRHIGAHVHALEKKLGRRLLPGMMALHNCDVKNCIEPEHLYEGDKEDNLRDAMDRKGFTPWNQGDRKNQTHCARGHLLSGENLAIGTYGGRICRTCREIRRERYKDRSYNKR